MSTDPLDDFSRFTFTHEGAGRRVYQRGEGPAVLVMHEIPGITPPVADFARFVADAGFTVFLPSLFGVDGRPLSIPYAASSLARACISKEFRALSLREVSPITDWLRALSRHAFAQRGGRGVGALGMCFTGNFALTLVMDPHVVAPVLSQPSLPLPLTAAHRRALHLREADLHTLKRRCRDEGLCVLGLRFTGDLSSPPERFERLREELGKAFEGIEIPSEVVPDAMGPGGPHSVLTNDLRDIEGHPTLVARDRVVSFFREHLCDP